MKYKSIAKNTRGFLIRWPKKGIFPDYRNVSGPYVSQKRINKAKRIVIQLLRDEERNIIRAFTIFAKRRYRKQQVFVEVDIEAAIYMVENAILHNKDEDMYGESDGECMWISAIKMSGELLIGTMIHEALHNIGTFNGNDICECDEHAIMTILGERW